MGREHIANLAVLDGVHVAVVADIFEAAAVAAAASCGAAPSTDPIAVAADPDLDAVVIASPDDTHADFAIAAIEHGKYVLCEKPLASTAADAERVVDAERAAGRALVQVGFMRQFDPAHLEVRDAMATLGPLRFLRCVHRNTNVAWQRPLEVVFSQSLIHDVHTARWLSAAEFTSVDVQVVSGPRPVEHVVILGAMTSGASIIIEFTEATYGYDVEVDATCEGGMVSAAQPAQPVVRRDGAVHRHVGNDWFGRFRDAYRAELVNWVDGVRAATVRGPDSADGLAAQRVIDAAIRSAASDRRETV